MTSGPWVKPTRTPATGANIAVCRRIEEALGDLTVKYVEAYALLYPEVGACSAVVADGRVCFAGRSSPLNRATGLGLHGPVNGSNIRAAEEFLMVRDATPTIETSPMRDESLQAVLERRGYRVGHTLHLYWRDLQSTSDDVSSPLRSDLSIAQLDQNDLEHERVWTLTVGQGFAGSMDPSPPYMDIYTTIFRSAGTTPFLATVNGVPAGGGALKISGNVAVLSTASTAPMYRRTGVQSALIGARLQAAREADCDIAAIEASPGSDSERNIARAGFFLAYGVSDMVRD